MAILLGKYGEKSTPFYLYSYKSEYYMCLEDIDYIFLNQQLYSKSKMIKQIYLSRPKDFMKESSTGRLFVMTRTMIPIARLFNCYSLAELCKLSSHEILGNVAEPIFNLIRCDHWHATTSVPGDRIHLQFESLSGTEWDKTVASPTKPTELLFEIQFPKHRSNLYSWLSSNIYETDQSPSTLRCLIDSATIKKQQQAIIETRLRKVAFRNNYRTFGKKNIAGNNLQKPKLPPSPPVQFRKRKQEQQQPQQDSCPNKRTRASHYGMDNLTLLATQATQLRGLPLSPEVSPSPPPLMLNTNNMNNSNNTYRLPSLKNMLSGLPPPPPAHHFHTYKRGNMDSCA